MKKGTKKELRDRLKRIDRLITLKEQILKAEKTEYSTFWKTQILEMIIELKTILDTMIEYSDFEK